MELDDSKAGRRKQKNDERRLTTKNDKFCFFLCDLCGFAQKITFVVLCVLRVLCGYKMKG